MSLENVSKEVAPIYGGKLDLGRPEEQLIEAFQKARAALFAALPKDARLDAGEAKLAADLVGQQIQAQQSAIIPSLQTRRDLPEANAISMDSVKSRQYYIGKYVVAAQGLGGYPAGLAREAVQAGAMTQQQYLDGIEVRLRAFSEIIHVGETGQLVDLVNGEKRGGNILVTTPGDGIIERPGMSGLGFVVTGSMILGVIAIAIVAGLTYYFTQKHKTDLTVAMMSRNCSEAMRQGNERAIKWCKEFANQTAGGGAIANIFGAKGQEQLLRYLGYAGMGYLAILLLPSLTQSVLSTQEVIRERKK